MEITKYYTYDEFINSHMIEYLILKNSYALTLSEYYRILNNYYVDILNSDSLSNIKSKYEIVKINNYITNELIKLTEINQVDNIVKRDKTITTKIHSKITNIQAVGFLFTEMIEKGLIQPKRKNGKVSPLNTARMILEHFYFEDLEDQPSEEYIAKTLFENNKFSEDKTELFHFPTLKQINEKL